VSLASPDCRHRRRLPKPLLIFPIAKATF
jgi:hypothetical protein